MRSFRESAIAGIKWSSVSQLGRQGTQLLTTAILAHLLDPADFGLVGMATVVIGFVALFKDLGTSAAVIQRKDLSENLVTSIFWLNAAFGLMAMVLLFLMSPLVATFYQEPRVIPLLRLLSLTFLISSLSSIQQALLERDLAFNKLAKLEITATVFGSIVGVVAALLGCGALSLVYQMVTVTTVTTIMLCLVSRWKPSFLFHWKEIKAVSSYSLNLTGYSIFNYFVRNADYLFIGRYLGAQNLGYYTLAYRIMLYPLQSVSAVISRVMFPLYSQIQDDDSRFGNTYLRVAGAVALVTFPMMFGLWILAEPFVLFLFGPRWEPVVLLLIILAPVGLTQSISTTVGAIYQAKGRTDIMFRWGVASGTLAVTAFLIGLRWGITGVATAYAFVSFVLLYPSFAIPLKLINLRVSALGRSLMPPLLSSIAMMATLFCAKTLIADRMTHSVQLGMLVPFGFIVYLLANIVLNKDQFFQIMNVFRTKT